MIALDTTEYRKKWTQLKNRCNNAKSYLAKGIKNEFESFEQFVDYCISKGFKAGDHCHRPSRHDNYRPGNLEFLDPEEHYRISGYEQRRLTVEQVKEIRSMALKGHSQRRIARQFPISQPAIHKIITRQTYKDV